MASGDTKTEQMLDVLGNGGDASQFRGCCNTKTQNYILDAIDRVQKVEDDVEEIKNNPDVVDIVDTYQDLENYDTSKLTDKDVVRVLNDETHDGESTYYRYDKHNDTWTYIGTTKQYTDFVGTDGQTAGTAGLVPAPATTDADKYLKSDGTWATAGGGSVITTLTASDYNYLSGTKIAAWLLDDGIYDFESSTVAANMYYERTNFDPSNVIDVSFFEVVTSQGSPKTKTIEGFYRSPGTFTYPSFTMTVDASTGDRAVGGFAYTLATTSVEQSTGTSTSRPMSQNATTRMVFADPGSQQRVCIGYSSQAQADGTVAIGSNSNATSFNTTAVGSGATASNGGCAFGGGSQASGTGAVAIGPSTTAGTRCVAIGEGSNAREFGGIACGAYSSATQRGQMDVSTSMTAYGYNSSNYRLLTGLYDPQSAHDAATKGYVDGITETYTIATTDWTALANSAPYTYQATVTATYTVGANTIAELLNDNPVEFATYGFAIGDITGQTVTFYSIGQPSASETLKINYKR